MCFTKKLYTVHQTAPGSVKAIQNCMTPNPVARQIWAHPHINSNGIRKTPVKLPTHLKFIPLTTHHLHTHTHTHTHTSKTKASAQAHGCKKSRGLRVFTTLVMPLSPAVASECPWWLFPVVTTSGTSLPREKPQSGSEMGKCAKMRRWKLSRACGSFSNRSGFGWVWICMLTC